MLFSFVVPRCSNKKRNKKKKKEEKRKEERNFILDFILKTFFQKRTSQNTFDSWNFSKKKKRQRGEGEKQFKV